MDLAEMLIEAAEDKKAWDPVIVDLQGKTTVADYFVICDGETDRQLRSIADDPAGLRLGARSRVPARRTRVLRPREPLGCCREAAGDQTLQHGELNLALPEIH
jgi:hypothetical protein